MKTAEEILLQHFGCIHPAPLCNGYGIDLTQQEIIKNAMKAYAEQTIDRCAAMAKTKLEFQNYGSESSYENVIDTDSILRVKSELK